MSPVIQTETENDIEGQTEKKRDRLTDLWRDMQANIQANKRRGRHRWMGFSSLARTLGDHMKQLTASVLKKKKDPKHTRD